MGSSVLPSPHSLKSQYASYSTGSRSFPNSPGFQPGVLALWWLWSPSSWWLWSPSLWCWLGTRIWSSSPSWWVGLPFRNGWPVWWTSWWVWIWGVWQGLWWQLWRLWWWKRIWQGQQKLRQQGIWQQSVQTFLQRYSVLPHTHFSCSSHCSYLSTNVELWCSSSLPAICALPACPIQSCTSVLCWSILHTQTTLRRDALWPTAVSRKILCSPTCEVISWLFFKKYYVLVFIFYLF